jgi:hypothetical protein
MVPFRVIDQDSKQMWIVLNYHPGAAPGDQGTYLVAKQDEEERDLPMQIINAAEMAKFRLVDFLDDGEDYYND